MDEETLLRRKILDTANKSYNQNIYTYTGFLGLSELAIYNSMKKNFNLLILLLLVEVNQVKGRLYDSEVLKFLDMMTVFNFNT